MPGRWFGMRLFMACVLAVASSQTLAEESATLHDGVGLGCLVSGPSPATLSEHRDQLPPKIDPLTIRVRMRFSEPNGEPATEIVFSNADEGLNASVIDHVRHYRLPCLTSGHEVVGLQEFVFLDDGRPVVWHPVRAVERKPDNLSCARSFRPGQPGAGAYALQARNEAAQGNVLLRLTFSAPDRPPRTEVLYEGGRGLGQAAQAIAEAYRLPCMLLGMSPVEAKQTFIFRLNDFASVQFKDIDLRQFLGMVADLGQQKVLFDFRTMACPFETDFTLWQPYLSNGVGESTSGDPNRREFAEWLATVSTKLPPKTLSQLIGTGMKVSVPCTVLNLL